jgi:hypothetical protein
MTRWTHLLMVCDIAVSVWFVSDSRGIYAALALQTLEQVLLTWMT